MGTDNTSDDIWVVITRSAQANPASSATDSAGNVAKK
jgi:hypothetical protein